MKNAENLLKIDKNLNLIKTLDKNYFAIKIEINIFKISNVPNLLILY